MELMKIVSFAGNFVILEKQQNKHASDNYLRFSIYRFHSIAVCRQCRIGTQ